MARERAAPGPHRPAPRRLSPADARAYLEAPLTDAEREHVLDLVRWFTTRYPTPLERLAYVRRAYARWQRTHGAALSGRIVRPVVGRK